MICVYAASKVKQGQEENYISLAQKLVEETHKEQGNLSYDFGKVKGTEDTYAFVERWESKEALKEHFLSSHFQDLTTKMGEYTVEGSSVLYQVEV